VGYIVLAIPIFFLLIGLELLVVRLQGKDWYRLDDSINDLSCGIMNQLVEVFVKTTLFAGYLYLYQNHRLLTLSATNPWVYVLGFIATDFFYYWYHRQSHEMGVFWAAHVVHHQSEEYNLSVALRQNALSFAWIFYLPLAVIGLPPVVFLTVSSINTLYQFWIHTRAIGKLGPLEWVLTTPSNHRVHHARNPKYIDRNYGGTLIVWDRLFGTFKEEEEEPVYGITTPLRSWNPLWANLSHWATLVGYARQARGWDRLRFFWKRPGWRPESMGGTQTAPEVDRASYRKFTTPVSRATGVYVFTQFVVALGIATYLLNAQSRLARPWLVAGAALTFWALVNFGALFEGRRWAKGSEALRAATLALAGLVLWRG